MNHRGFTVMEILVALFLFSIVLLPLTGLFVADSKFEKKYEQKQVAILVAKNELEKAKRSFRKPEDKEYEVTMAGRSWNVEVIVEEKERALTGAQSAQQPQIAGRLSTLLQPAQTAPGATVKQLVTVRVSRDNDTNALAEFRALGETYR